MTDLEVFGIFIGFGIAAGAVVLCTYEGLGLVDGPNSLLDRILEKPAKVILDFMEKRLGRH